jgi:hypothetical protein
MADNTDETVIDDEVEQDDQAEKVEEDKTSDDKDEEVVPVRKSVLNAQRRIIEKQNKKLQDTSKEDNSDEELTPKARKLIEEAVSRAVSPLQDELSVRDWFANHPEDRKFEKKARARFEAWENVPIEEVMKTLRPTGIEPEEKAKAEEKVTRNSIKGSSGKAKEETVATTQAELKKVYQQVKSGDKSGALRALGIK